MPDDLLLELTPAAAVAGSLEHIEALVSDAVQDVGRAVVGMHGSAVLFQRVWRRMVMDVARGQTAEMHAARPGLLNAFSKRLDQLKLTHHLAVWLRKAGREDVPDPDILLPDIQGMEQLKTGVFDRWQTADDLEDLAAKDYPLTNGDLDQIGSHRRPPASFYAEEGKPF